MGISNHSDVPRVAKLALWYLADDLRAEFRRLRDWRPDSEVTGENLRELVSLTGEAGVLLPEGEPVARALLARTWTRTVLARCADLPANAVAVNTDRTYMTVPSGIGVIADMAGPRFFTADDQAFGRVILPGSARERRGGRVRRDQEGEVRAEDHQPDSLVPGRVHHCGRPIRPGPAGAGSP